MESANNQSIYKLTGAKIAHLRGQKKMSQLDLAGQLGMSRASVVNIEKGRQHPSLHLLWQLAIALDVALPDLLPKPAELAAEALTGHLNFIRAAGSSESANKLTDFINLHLGAKP